MNDSVDKTGRIVIPQRIREACGLTTGVKLEFVPVPDSEEVILRKKRVHFCVSCHSGDRLMELSEGVYLCRDCIRKRLLSEGQ